MRPQLYISVIVVSTLLLATTVVSAEEIKIGVLADLSGDLSSYGLDIKNNLEIAKEKINKYFESKGMPYNVNFYYEDTKVDPNIALQKVQDLDAKGVDLIIGPMGSGEVKNILNYVASNKIIIISPSSTAAPKYIGVTKPEEKKYIFRFVATDAFQTKAIAKIASDLGIKAVIITYVGNAWGKGLEEFGRMEFENAGIEVYRSSVEYPDNPKPTDFSPYLASIENAVSELLGKYKPNEIAVVAFSYEEVATMLAQTKEDSKLLSVWWLGCDGTAKSAKVIEDVPKKASNVKLISTVSEQRGGKSYDELVAIYSERYGGTPKSYGMNAYDAAWVLALSYVEVVSENGAYGADKMAEKIKEVAEKYSKGEYGVEPVSGAISFDEYNDRVVPEYRIYAVINGDWKDLGVWKYPENAVSWTQKPEPPATTVEETKKTPGFELAIAVVGVLAGAYLIRRRQ
jgi:branched-chain amino acid transport system substrate-binding protein